MVALCEHSLEESLNFIDVFWRLVHLSEAVANFMAQQVAAGLRIKGEDECVDCFEGGDRPEAEESTDTVGHRLGGVLEGGCVLWDFVVLDEDHCNGVIIIH